MSKARASVILWAAAMLLLPLPYFVVAEGWVPVVRFAMMTTIAVAYAGGVDGSGVAWPMALILAVHTIAYSVGLAAVATIVARIVPNDARRGCVLALVVAALVCAFALDPYRTPFDDAQARSSWAGLFQ